MTPGTAAGMAGDLGGTGIDEMIDETGVDEIGITAPAVTIGFLAGIDDTLGSTTGITGGLTGVKSIDSIQPDSVNLEVNPAVLSIIGDNRGYQVSNFCFLDTL